MDNVKDIRRKFAAKYQNGEFVTDKTGVKTVELIGNTFIADEPTIFGKINDEYIEAEKEWYHSLSTNINDIYGESRKPPVAWTRAADEYGNINSNYGHLIFSPIYFNQYAEAVYELHCNPDTRRAVMVYNRPSIWEEYKENGKSDFICTNAVGYNIRDGKLNAVVQMRSNDVWAGYRNDFAWQDHILDMMLEDLTILSDTELKKGNIYWQVMSLHIYEHSFKYLDNYLKTGEHVL